MRAVSGEVVSWKPEGLGKTARLISSFAALEASCVPAETAALVVSAAKAAAELHAFRRDAGAGAGESTEKPRKKRKRSGTGL